jgi:hypothetical protein
MNIEIESKHEYKEKIFIPEWGEMSPPSLPFA